MNFLGAIELFSACYSLSENMQFWCAAFSFDRVAAKLGVREAFVAFGRHMSTVE
jgi:hypothetical protein